MPFFWVVVLILTVHQNHAQAYPCNSYPHLCNLKVTSTIANADFDQAIDIVFIGDCFTDGASFRAVANNFISTFKAQTAAGIYQLAPNLFNFHIVEVISETTNCANDDTSDSALSTAKISGSGTMISMNTTKMNVAALNAPDVDVTFAIANSSRGRANANYASTLMSGGRVRMASGQRSPLSHELGHALFVLGDEYVESSKCKTPPRESTLLRRDNLTTDPSCLKFKNTAGAGCVAGGYYCSAGVYRSASSCLMRSSGNRAFCPACKRTIKEMLMEKRTGVGVAEPWAVVTSPAKGTTINGQVYYFRAQGFDHWFVGTVLSLRLDGSFIGSSEPSTSAYAGLSVKFDTTILKNGPHTLTPYITDALGHTRQGVPVTFTVENAPDAADCTVDGDCDDKDACTDDSCDAGTCKHVARPSSECCSIDHDCDDADVCTANVCSGPGGTCTNPALGGYISVTKDCPCTDASQCDDHNPCTLDTCDAGGVCAHSPDNGATCDDGIECTKADTCQDGLCKGGPINCDDGNACTFDFCYFDKCRNDVSAILTGCYLDAGVPDGLDLSIPDQQTTDDRDQGVPRRDQQVQRPDLAKPDLMRPDLMRPDLMKADLMKADLMRPDLMKADAMRPDLVKADSLGLDTSGGDLTTADRSHADDKGLDLRQSDGIRDRGVKRDQRGADLLAADAKTEPVKKLTTTRQLVGGCQLSGEPMTTGLAPLCLALLFLWVTRRRTPFESVACWIARMPVTRGLFRLGCVGVLSLSACTTQPESSPAPAQEPAKNISPKPTDQHRVVIAPRTALLMISFRPNQTARIDGVVVKDFRFTGHPTTGPTPTVLGPVGQGLIEVRVDKLVKHRVAIDLGYPGEGGGDVADRWQNGGAILRAPALGPKTSYRLYYQARTHHPAVLLDQYPRPTPPQHAGPGSTTR